jgi:hypothetical protein
MVKFDLVHLMFVPSGANKQADAGFGRFSPHFAKTLRFPSELALILFCTRNSASLPLLQTLLTTVNANMLNAQEGARDIESALRTAQKSGTDMNPVIRQDYLGTKPEERQAALDIIKNDRKTVDPSLPALQITERDGDVSVKTDAKQSWSSWGKEQLSGVETNINQNISKGQEDFKEFEQATIGTVNTWRLLIPGQT